MSTSQDISDAASAAVAAKAAVADALNLLSSKMDEANTTLAVEKAAMESATQAYLTAFDAEMVSNGGAAAQAASAQADIALQVAITDLVNAISQYDGL